MNAAALELVSELELFKGAQRILIFNADQFELDLTPLVKKFPKKTYAFPAVSHDGTLIFRSCSDISAFVPDTMGIASPSSECPYLPPEQVDFAFIPCQAIDSTNHRLGRGGGFYDRFLERYGKCFYSLSVVPYFAYYHSLPKESFDLPVSSRIVISGDEFSS